MNINNSLKKFSFFDYSVIFIFIFYAGGASTFARSYETWENLYSVAFILIITIIFKKFNFSNFWVFNVFFNFNS